LLIFLRNFQYSINKKTTSGQVGGVDKVEIKRKEKNKKDLTKENNCGIITLARVHMFL
jgi:hypothetical protein